VKRGKILIGLTGSIGMGKSTTAKMFSAHGIPVWDADAAVARLYQPGGSAVVPVGAAFPDAIVDGAVSKDKLKEAIQRDPEALARLEKIVHPLVRDDRETFITETASPILLLDIPLLFETGSPDDFDLIVVVSAPADVQRARVLERPGMTEKQLDLILSKQMPDAEKRRQADYVIPTTDLVSAEKAVDEVVKIAQNWPDHA